MNYVEPIRSIEKLNSILAYLKQYSYRNYVMFALGIYAGFRISDILKLRVKDVKGKTHFDIIEKKTGKRRKIAINPELSRILDEHIKGMEYNDHLIMSREGYNQSISRDMAYKIIKAACERFGVRNTGTHTLRKTFGYHYYQKTGDIETLRILFNHSHWSITAKYIGITDDTIQDAFLKISY